ncbi:phosphotransferase family protein [Streptacidiphilus sp. EB103A]|uniref:phosphotransferase family protein n=1 Tax=Streptacidiphilus sp. EB103A TaxID=3156275 RepID=UPI00351650D6
MAVETEVPLTGGRITPGVVRVGDTVRRAVTAAPSFVAQLLGHLQEQGFTGAPRHLGTDRAGRDVLTYLPGWVPPRFRTWADCQVAAAGALLRGLHDATRGSLLAGDHPVVCHGDPGPNNIVFSSEGDAVPVALIDFDTAAPGDPVTDIAYMAWTFCVSSKPTTPPTAVQAAQVRVLTDAYGLDAASRTHLPDAMLERQAHNARCWSSHLDRPRPRVTDDHQITERIRWSEREHAHTAANHHVSRQPCADYDDLPPRSHKLLNYQPEERHPMGPTIDRPAPQVTATHLRTLLDSSAEHPVLYISYGEDSEVELDVWAAGLVHQADIVLTRATALDLLGEEPDSETITAFLPTVQQAVDEMISVRGL